MRSSSRGPRRPTCRGTSGRQHRQGRKPAAPAGATTQAPSAVERHSSAASPMRTTASWLPPFGHVCSASGTQRRSQRAIRPVGTTVVISSPLATLAAVPGEDGAELLRSDWLCDVVLHPELLRRSVHLTGARHYDHRDRGEVRVAELLSAEPPTVSHRQHEVEKDRAEVVLLPYAVESLLAVSGRRDVVALGLQQRLHRLAAVGVVLDEEDPMAMPRLHPGS